MVEIWIWPDFCPVEYLFEQEAIGKLSVTLEKSNNNKWKLLEIKRARFGPTDHTHCCMREEQMRKLSYLSMMHKSILWNQTNWFFKILSETHANKQQCSETIWVTNWFDQSAERDSPYLTLFVLWILQKPILYYVFFFLHTRPSFLIYQAVPLRQNPQNRPLIEVSNKSIDWHFFLSFNFGDSQNQVLLKNNVFFDFKVKSVIIQCLKINTFLIW